MRTLAPILLATLLTTPALAEDGGPPTASSEAPTALARGRDASIDRGLLTTHAETLGEGKWAFNAYELVFIGLTYGFTDDIQASISTLLPITTEIPLVLAIQPKFVLSRTEDTVISLRAPFTFTGDSDSDDSVFTFGAGALVDHRLDKEGRFALHGGLLVTSALGTFGFSDEVDVADGAILELDLGASLGVSNTIKIILEAQMFAAITDNGFDFVDVALINYGIRFHSGSLAGDLGFIRPVGVDTDPLLLGVPYLAFSARF